MPREYRRGDHIEHEDVGTDAAAPGFVRRRTGRCPIRFRAGCFARPEAREYSVAEGSLDVAANRKLDLPIQVRDGVAAGRVFRRQAEWHRRGESIA